MIFKLDIQAIIIASIVQAKLNTALIPHTRGRDERLELPEDALREALVNAIAHRDYRSSANVQIYIFHDRLEIVTPGGLPAGMHEEDLGIKSVPRNPLLFGMFYRMGMVEQVGSGIKRIREMCRDYKVAEPIIQVSEHWVTTTFKRPSEEVAGEDTQQVRKVVSVLQGEQSRGELMDSLSLKDRMHFVNEYLQPSLDGGWVEMTIPDKPRNRNQKYRLTAKGKVLHSNLKKDV